MFIDLEFFDAYVEKIVIGVKIKYVFYELPYWEHIKIPHLLYPWQSWRGLFEKGKKPEGYIIYESFYYASEYIKKIDNAPGGVVWYN